MSQAVTFPARDGVAIAGSWYGEERTSRVVLVAPATGVKRRLYDAIARHLAAAGYGVLTLDWRGTGDSRPASLRGFEASMRDWATKDLAGAIDWLEARVPDATRICLGHSFGGQSIGLAPNGDRIDAIATVAAQSGYWGHWPKPGGYKYALLWYAVVPPLTRALGYMPARRLGLGEDLPRGVALQWASWCRRPEYLGDWSGHARITAPILAYSFADDEYAPRRAVEALHIHYGSRQQRHVHVLPADLGVERMGHFGFFREASAPLWADLLRWLDAVVPAAPGH